MLIISSGRTQFWQVSNYVIIGPTHYAHCVTSCYTMSYVNTDFEDLIADNGGQ